MEYKNIKLEKEDGIAVVTIDRPKVLNALNDETIAELDHCFVSIAGDKDVLCVVLTLIYLDVCCLQRTQMVRAFFGL